MTSRWPCISLIGALAVACHSADDGLDDEAADEASDRLSPLDTAFLVPPLPDGNLQFAIAETGAKGNVLEPDDFAEIHAQGEYNAEQGAAAGLVGDESEIYASTFLTSFRYDPCSTEAFHGQAATPNTGEACNHEIRIVFQTFGDGGFADAAVHLAFELDETESAMVRERLHAMKKACNKSTAGAPIGPHPCLEGPNARAFFDEHVRPILFALAGKDAFKAAAILVRSGTEWHWRFFVKLPVLGFKLLEMLPNIGGREFAALHSDGTYAPATSLLRDPKGNAVPSIAIEKLTAGDPATAPVADIAESVVAAYLIENPRLTRLPDAGAFIKDVLNPLKDPPAVVDGADCGSCHGGNQVMTVAEEAGLFQRIAEQDPALQARLESLAYKPLDRLRAEHLPAARKLHQEMRAAGRAVVISFGFLGDSPSVNRRTQHEAEDVARYIDEVLEP